MQLEDYFDFLAPNDIRLKGHRIGIETILFDYLDGLMPEELVFRYPTLSLEEVYATITYYWRNQNEIDAYLHAAEEHEARMRHEQELNPPPVVKRLRELAKARRAVTLAGNLSGST
ncbi:MAG: hypothetical protein A2Z04_00390 [Chloroflexi bacterium RBG_16_57_9]|nr:MAG: hypothetical protein A2Z04_00390 [Chloroflexi bacterium RBG_16_57_9]